MVSIADEANSIDERAELVARMIARSGQRRGNFVAVGHGMDCSTLWSLFESAVARCEQRFLLHSSCRLTEDGRFVVSVPDLLGSRHFGQEQAHAPACGEELVFQPGQCGCMGRALATPMCNVDYSAKVWSGVQE